MNTVTISIIYVIVWVVTSIITYYVLFSPLPSSTKEYKSDAKIGATFYGMIWPVTLLFLICFLIAKIEEKFTKNGKNNNTR